MSLLYHFTTYKIALEYILPKMELRTNDLLHTNDPRETNLCAFGGINIPYDDLFPSLKDSQTAQQFCLGRYIKSQVQAICFSFGEEFWCNEMMWTLYASNHSGVCLAVDEDMFKDENGHLLSKEDGIWEVGYVEIPKPSIIWDNNLTDRENISNFSKLHKEWLFLHKSKFWTLEKEKRLLIFNQPQFQYFSINKSLKELYLGIYFPSSYLPLVNHYTEEKEIDIYDCAVGLQKPLMERSKRSKDNRILVDRYYLELCEKNPKPVIRLKRRFKFYLI